MKNIKTFALFEKNDEFKDLSAKEKSDVEAKVNTWLEETISPERTTDDDPEDYALAFREKNNDEKHWTGIVPKDKMAIALAYAEHFIHTIDYDQVRDYLYPKDANEAKSFSPVFHANEKNKKTLEQANAKVDKDVDELIGSLDDAVKDLPEIKKTVAMVEAVRTFSKEYNKVFREVEEDLFSSDHDKIKAAYDKLKVIYPHELIRTAGVLTLTRKRYRRSIDRFTPAEDKNRKIYLFMKQADDLVESIRNRYDMLNKSKTHIGKTDAQRGGYGRLAAAGRMRWAE